MNRPIARPDTVDATERVLDITGEVCPMTMVRTRLALDALPAGALLVVRLRGDEPRRSVPASVDALGHRVLAVDDEPGGVTRLRIRKTTA